jgi:ribosomal protein S18 acetylase RimI-like enzyme
VAPFVVLALPRSRTLWLSRFLSYGNYHCGHDEIQHMRSLEDCRTWFRQPCIGTVETAAAPFWRLLPPGLRIVTVRRPVEDVLASVVRVLPGCDRAAMDRLLRAADRKLDQVEARVPDVLPVDYEDLADEGECKRLFEFCLPYPHDPAWWAAWHPTRVSGNLPAQVRYCTAYLPQLTKLARAAKQAMLAELHNRQRVPLDGFVFADEPFEQWLNDAQPLFRQHLARTGQDSDGYALKNLPLGRRLDAAGAMQITTARLNGRLFGYLMSVISPSLDQRGILMAQNLLPFAAPECPGLGLRLQRAAIEMLREKGVSQVYARAGVRGDGPRLGALYQRLGFVDDGQLYRREL